MAGHVGGAMVDHVGGAMANHVGGAMADHKVQVIDGEILMRNQTLWCSGVQRGPPSEENSSNDSRML